MIREAISEHPGESRREWMVWLMERAGMRNSNNNEWQLWQQHNKPIEILNMEMFYQKMEYVHRNPVEAGFVENEEDYLHSSARDFFDKKGLIDLFIVCCVSLKGTSVMLAPEGGQENYVRPTSI